MLRRYTLKLAEWYSKCSRIYARLVRVPTYDTAFSCHVALNSSSHKIITFSYNDK